MENASKALLMAGGILISVLIISVCVMVYNNMSSLSNSRGQILEAEQLAKYNMEWESYNRDDLRGADVISIINKAISTNEKYKNELDDDNFTMINVYIKITEDVGETTETWEYDNTIKKYIKTGTTYDKVLDKRTYNLMDDDDYKKLENFVKKANSTTDEYEYVYKNDDKTYPSYEKIINEFATFKLLDFKCEDTGKGEDEYKDSGDGIKYDDYGRIVEIHLIEI